MNTNKKIIKKKNITKHHTKKKKKKKKRKRERERKRGEWK